MSVFASESSVFQLAAAISGGTFTNQAIEIDETILFVLGTPLDHGFINLQYAYNLKNSDVEEKA